MERLWIKNRWSNRVQIMLVSLVSAIFAFTLLQLLSELTLLYFSYDLNIQAILHLKGIDFLTKTTSPDWTRDSVITIYLSKPIMNLMLALSGMVVYSLIRRKSQSFTYFLIWLIIFALNNAFGIFAENGLFKTGTYEVTQLMHFGGSMMMVVVMISFYFLYLSGVGIGKLILLSLPEEFIKNNRIDLFYFLTAYLIPWLLTFLVIFSGSDPGSRIVYLISIVILVPILWARSPDTEAVHQEPLPPLMWIDFMSFIFYFAGIYLMYTMLSTGIKIN